MSHASQTDLVNRFGTAELIQAAGDGEDPEGIDSTKVAKALADADGMIDSYLRARYSVPLSTPPAEIVDAACNIARYRLHDDFATDDIRRRFEDARSWLRDIASQRASLDASASAPAAASTDDLTGGEANSVAVSRSSPMVFTDAVMGAMV